MLAETTAPPVEEFPPIEVHPQVCPLCGVRATLWQPRIVSGVLLVRMRCWEGHDWSLTAVVSQ